MYFEALKIFCDVVRQRSFSRAAAANAISQSAASQNVLQLEKGLGVRLIDRSKRPFELTEEGRVYYEGCRTLVDRYYAVEAEVKAMADEVAGPVSVAAIYSVGLGDMSRFVQEFARTFPKVNLQLAYLHPDRVYQCVLNDEADLGLISYPKKRRGLVAIPWRREPMVVVCPRGHHLAARTELTAEALDGEAFVAFDEGLAIRQEIDRQLRKHDVEVRVCVAFDNIETIKRAVEIGEGIAILPEPAVRTQVQGGTLVAIPLVAPAMHRPLAIIHRRNGKLTRAVQCFVDLLQRNGHDPAASAVVLESGVTRHDPGGNGHPLDAVRQGQAGGNGQTAPGRKVTV